MDGAVAREVDHVRIGTDTGREDNRISAVIIVGIVHETMAGRKFCVCGREEDLQVIRCGLILKSNSLYNIVLTARHLMILHSC